MHTAVGGSRRLGLRMGQLASGPLVSFSILLLLPLGSAVLLPSRDFALWVVFNTVVALSVMFDFGGGAYALARASGPRGDLRRVAASAVTMSTTGSAIVGVIAIGAWLPYSQTSVGQQWDLAGALLALLILTVAGILRSISVITANMLFELNCLFQRNTILIGQAVLACLIVLGLAATTRSVWCLPIGWLLASLVAAIGGWLLLSRHFDGSAPTMESDVLHQGESAERRRFSADRSLATVLSGLCLQGDRWVVGALAGPVVLSAYEVAWRIASVPRAVAATTSGSLIGEAARLGDAPSATPHLQRRALGLTSATVTVTFIIMFGTAAGLGASDVLGVNLGYFLLLSAGLCANAVILPLINVALGRGMGRVDLSLWGASLLAMILVWLLAHYMGNQLLVVGAAPIALTGSAFVFYCQYLNRRPRKRYLTAKSTGLPGGESRYANGRSWRASSN